MSELNQEFVRLVNENAGIAHKISRIYFSDEDDRKDALQEMLYRTWRAYPDFRGDAKFSTWMYRICLNTALTFRRNRKNVKVEPFTIHRHDRADLSEDEAHSKFAMMNEAISRLSPVNKAIILLFLEDMSYEEIASVTGLTKSNVSVRLVRIKKELEQTIKSLNK